MPPTILALRPNPSGTGEIHFRAPGTAMQSSDPRPFQGARHGRWQGDDFIAVGREVTDKTGRKGHEAVALKGIAPDALKDRLEAVYLALENALEELTSMHGKGDAERPELIGWLEAARTAAGGTLPGRPAGRRLGIVLATLVILAVASASLWAFSGNQGVREPKAANKPAKTLPRTPTVFDELGKEWGLGDRQGEKVSNILGRCLKRTPSCETRDAEDLAKILMGFRRVGDAGCWRMPGVVREDFPLKENPYREDVNKLVKETNKLEKSIRSLDSLKDAMPEFSDDKRPDYREAWNRLQQLVSLARVPEREDNCPLLDGHQGKVWKAINGLKKGDAQTLKELGSFNLGARKVHIHASCEQAAKIVATLIAHRTPIEPE